MEEERYLKPQQVCEWLNISLGHLANLARDGVIPHIMVGTARRYPESKLREWLKAQENIGEENSKES